MKSIMENIEQYIIYGPYQTNKKNIEASQRATLMLLGFRGVPGVVVRRDGRNRDRLSSWGL